MCTSGQELFVVFDALKDSAQLRLMAFSITMEVVACLNNFVGADVRNNHHMPSKIEQIAGSYIFIACYFMEICCCGEAIFKEIGDVDHLCCPCYQTGTIKAACLLSSFFENKG